MASQFPSHLPPSSRHYQFGEDLDAQLRRDRDAGVKKVLLSHGASALIRAGFLDVPLDRVLSLVELMWAGKDDESGMMGRIQSGYYDRLYLVTAWWFLFYPDAYRTLIEEKYREVRVIKGYEARGEPSLWDPNFEAYFDAVKGGVPYGYQFGLMGDVRVMEKRTNEEPP